MLSPMRWFAGLAFVVAMLTAPARADEAAAPPPEARALIERQLDAFAHDDAEAAFALAAPGIREMFTDPATFMAMVKSSYAPVYRHRSVEFGAFTRQGDEIDQVLTFVDTDNEVWNAVYRLLLQPDGSWKTTGCILKKSSQSSL